MINYILRFGQAKHKVVSKTSHLNTLQRFRLSQADSVKVLESASALPSTCHNSRETLLRLCLCMGMCLVCQRNTDPTVTTVYLLGLASMDILEIGDWCLPIAAYQGLLRTAPSVFAALLPVGNVLSPSPSQCRRNFNVLLNA